MQINVFIAGNTTMTCPSPGQYQFLFSQQLPGNRNALSQQQIDAAVDDALNVAVRPLIVTTGIYPLPAPFNWDSASHFTAWRNYDFGLAKKYCVRVDLI